MHDHPVPGPVWVPEYLRGMLFEFGREVEQEAFAELQFRLPPLPVPHGARLEIAGSTTARLLHPLLTRSGASPHPSGFGASARPRESGHP